MKRCGQWVVLAALLIMLTATATPGQLRPKKFCDCPDHKRPPDAASVSGGRHIVSTDIMTRFVRR